MRDLLNYCLSREREYDCYGSYLILLFRCFSGLMMIPYGYGKIVDYDRYAADFFGDPLGIGDLPSLWLTIFAQVVCPITLILGFQMRISAGILAFNMLVAVKYHFSDPFSIKALPMLFLGMYVILILWGAGRYSMDFCFYSSGGRRFLSRSERWSVWCVAVAFVILCVLFGNIVSGWIVVVLLIPVMVLFISGYYILRYE